jgi:hypothetical protein
MQAILLEDIVTTNIHYLLLEIIRQGLPVIVAIAESYELSVLELNFNVVVMMVHLVKHLAYFI